MSRKCSLAVALLCLGWACGCGNSARTGLGSGNNSDAEAPLKLNMQAFAAGELELTAPEDVTFECDSLLNDAALAQWLSSAEVESTCGNAAVLNDFTGLSDGCGPTGSATVTWAATDDCENALSHTASFAIADTTPPTIDGPPDTTVDCTDGTALALREWLNSASASDECGSVDLTREDEVIADGCPGAASTRATWTAVDACGASVTHTATFSVRGSIELLGVIPPEDVEVECDGLENMTAYARWLNAAVVDGGCGNEVVENAVTRESEPCPGESIRQITWTATDECGETASASAVFTIMDTTAPHVDAPEALALECGAPDNRALIDEWLDSVSGRDVCSDVSVSNDFTGLDDRCGNSGWAEVTWTVQDECGNQTAVSAELLVDDTMAPSLVVPEDSRFCTDDTDLGELRRWLASATADDACGDTQVSNDYSRAIVPATCVVDVTWTAVDACGHSTSDSATAAIQDEVPPAVTVNGESEVTLECNVDEYVERGASVVDACDIELLHAVVGGDTVDISTPGVYTVRYDATDVCGNGGDATRTVEVVDTLPPFAPDGIAIELWAPNHQYQTLSLADCVRDLCEVDLDVDALGQIIDVYSDEPENANGDGNTVDDIVILDNSSFMVRVERQGGGNGRVYGVTFEIADSAGNATRDTCYVGVPHDQSGAPAVDDGPAAGYTVSP